jgi:hypothetical protein
MAGAWGLFGNCAGSRRTRGTAPKWFLYTRIDDLGLRALNTYCDWVESFEKPIYYRLYQSKVLPCLLTRHSLLPTVRNIISQTNQRIQARPSFLGSQKSFQILCNLIIESTYQFDESNAIKIGRSIQPRDGELLNISP